MPETRANRRHETLRLGGVHRSFGRAAGPGPANNRQKFRGVRHRRRARAKRRQPHRLRGGIRALEKRDARGVPLTMVLEQTVPAEFRSRFAHGSRAVPVRDRAVEFRAAQRRRASALRRRARGRVVHQLPNRSRVAKLVGHANHHARTRGEVRGRGGEGRGRGAGERARGDADREFERSRRGRVSAVEGDAGA